MYVYIKTSVPGNGLWAVGFYAPSGLWQAESNWPSANQAAERVHWLNGGNLKSNASEGIYPSETAGVMQL